VQLRARVGMVFQSRTRSEVGLRERGLRAAHPWPRRRPHGARRDRADQPDAGRPVGKVKDRLDQPGTALSAASSSAVHRADDRREPRGDPDGRAVSALDPIATARIEDLIDELRQNYAICIVTHSMQQARAYRNARRTSTSATSSRSARRTRSSPIPHKLTEDYITDGSGDWSEVPVQACTCTSLLHPQQLVDRGLRPRLRVTRFTITAARASTCRRGREVARDHNRPGGNAAVVDLARRRS